MKNRQDLPNITECKETPQREIRYLAFSGGGWRTIYGRGVVDALQENSIFKNVIAASFCSGSCATAMYLMCGYNSEQNQQFLQKHVFENKSKSYLYFIPEHIDPEKTPYYKIKPEDGWVKRLSKKAANASIFGYLVLKNIVDACRSRGIFHPKGIEESMWMILKHSPVLPARLRKRDLTFLEYHQYKDEFRRLNPTLPCLDYYFAVAESKGKDLQLKYYSYETTPTYPILKAATAAMRIPVLVRQMRDEKNLADGGIIDVTARTAFDAEQYFDDNDVNTSINMRTLCFYFVGSEDSITRWRDALSNPQPAITCTEKLVLKIIGVQKYVKAQNKEHHVGANALRTLYMDTSDIPTLDLEGVTTEKYQEVCQKAKKLTNEHLKFYVFGATCPHTLQRNEKEYKKFRSISKHA